MPRTAPDTASDGRSDDSGIGTSAIRRRDKTVISSVHLHRMQRRHFALFDVLPFIGTIVAVLLLIYRPIEPIDIGLFVVMWLLTGLGLTVGFHRLFCHRSFATGNAVAVALLILGSAAGRGPMISWVAMHRRHHELADHEGDLHSPVVPGRRLSERLRGWMHAHLTWMIKHDYPNVAYYARDLASNDTLVKANRRYYVWVSLGLALPTLVGAVVSESLMGGLMGLLWGGAVRMFVVEQSMSAVNSLLHLIGSRSFAGLHDNSRNSALLGLLVWGEGWHNNHHAFPYSASFGLEWHQLDPGFWLIRMLQAVGLAWNVKVPSREKIIERMDRPSIMPGGEPRYATADSVRGTR
jgi:stearoyl-CoA desaturase (delta-9 desaturase)